VIEEGDALFREAMVISMAVTIAPTVIKDPKLRKPIVDGLIGRAKMTIGDARAASAQEMSFPQSTEHQPPWITGRNQGYFGAFPLNSGGLLGVGGTFMPWEPWSLGGSAF